MTLKLNIGAGPNVFPHPGWINYDKEGFEAYFSYTKTNSMVTGMPDHQRRLGKYLEAGGALDCRIHDMRETFPQHADNTVDAIYLGQVIEHLNPIYEVPTLLKECHRMLKPGGVLRITTPDLDLLLQAYAEGKMDKFSGEQPWFYANADPSARLAYLMYGACGPKCTWSNYEGHMFLFTKTSMTTALAYAGFWNPTFYYEPGKSLDPILALEVVDAGMSHSFITEVVKGSET